MSQHPAARPSFLSFSQWLLIGSLAVVALFLLAAIYQVARGQVQAAQLRDAQARIAVQTAEEVRAQRARLTAAFEQPAGVQSVSYTLAR
ncbi:MAG: hypothetical protein ACLGJD_04125 [Gammaproteobacteria bacterium]